MELIANKVVITFKGKGKPASYHSAAVNYSVSDHVMVTDNEGETELFLLSTVKSVRIYTPFVVKD
jgi:hypothetical protein